MAVANVGVSDSGLSMRWMEIKAARPKSGRPLQNRTTIMVGGFVGAVPFRVLLDGAGIFFEKINHYPFQATTGES